VSYGANVYGADCGSTLSAVVLMHLRAVLVIYVQRKQWNTSLHCNMQL